MAGPDFTGLGPLKIDSAQISYLVNGNVGIGTTSPGDRLVVSSPTAADTKIEIDANGDQYAALRIKNNQRSWIWQVTPSGDAPAGRFRLVDETALVERVSVDAGGNVGIGTASPQEKLDVAGDVRANNNVKVWDSGWFAVSALQALTKNHDLGTSPKSVIVWCAESASPTRMSVAGPFHVDSSGSGERGAYIARVDAASVQVRAGNYIGINEAGVGWLTSGYYKVVAWA